MTLSQGMDIQRVREIAAQLKKDARTLDGVQSRIQNAVNRMGENWHGADASRFISDWNSHSKKLTTAASDITAMSKVCDRNADQQEAASK
jgi:WXG100 family type VII secretion target